MGADKRIVGSGVCVWALVAATVMIVLLAVFCPVCLLVWLGICMVWVMLEELGRKRR